MNASITRIRPTETPERSYEEIRDALDKWLRGGVRTASVRAAPLGFTCALLQGGEPVAVARGTTSDSAIEHALEEAEAI